MSLVKILIAAAIFAGLGGCAVYVPANVGPSAGAVQFANRHMAIGYRWNNAGQYVHPGGMVAPMVQGPALVCNAYGQCGQPRWTPPLGAIFPYNSNVTCPQIPIGNGAARCQ